MEEAIKRAHSIINQDEIMKKAKLKMMKNPKYKVKFAMIKPEDIKPGMWLMTTMTNPAGQMLSLGIDIGLGYKHHLIALSAEVGISVGLKPENGIRYEPLMPNQKFWLVYKGSVEWAVDGIKIYDELGVKGFGNYHPTRNNCEQCCELVSGL